MRKLKAVALIVCLIMTVSVFGTGCGISGDAISGARSFTSAFIASSSGAFGQQEASAPMPADLADDPSDDPDHEHVWAEATCTEPKTCTICGLTMGDPLGHSWKEATCTEPMTCTVCGATNGDPMGHTWREATCTSPRTCPFCGATEGEPAGHSWREATCTEPKTCTVCGATEGDPLGHTWRDATCTAPKTCAFCGATEGSALGHNWKEATCTEPMTCTVCGATEGEPLGHNWTRHSCTEPMTCSVCGAAGEIPGHTWKEATCTEPMTCTVCGATEGEPMGHTWREATCTTPKTCAFCGAKEGEPLGHKWKEATCTEPKTCTICKATEGEPLGHKWKEATCTEPKTCTVCKATEGKPAGHKWTDATCTEPKTCTVCKATEGNALGHSWSEWIMIKEPGIDLEGEVQRKCSRCGKIESSPVKPLNGYIVTFDAMGGSLVTPRTAVENKTIAPPDAPTREGYEFLGWFLDKACTQRFDFSSGITSDITVYAGWKEVVPLAPISYSVTQGAGGSWTKGSTDPFYIVVKRNVDEASCFSHYVETLIDGQKVEVSAKSGSTIITISPETMEKLSVGGHTITVKFDDGEASLSMAVAEAASGNKGGQGKLLFLLIPAALLAGIAGFLIARRRKND